MIKQITVGVLRYLLAAFVGVLAIVAALSLVRWLRIADVVVVEMLIVGSVAIGATGWAAIRAALCIGSTRGSNAHVDVSVHADPPVELERDRMMVDMNANALRTVFSERISVVAPGGYEPDVPASELAATELLKRRREARQRTNNEAFTGTHSASSGA